MLPCAFLPFLPGCGEISLIVGTGMFSLFALSALYLLTWDGWDERQHTIWQITIIYIGVAMMILIGLFWEVF